MHRLLRAIKTKFTASGLDTTVTGGLFVERARNDATRPFLVLSLITAPITDAYQNRISYDATVQFSLHGTGLDDTLALMKTITDVYDDTTLTLTGATHIGIYRLDQPFPLQESDKHLGEDPSLIDEWQVICQYVYSVQ